MLIYPQGNYITSSPETPYLQIGESKYGKPALDRIVHPGLSLNQGARLALVSLDATTRSNITVGPPFELATYAKDSLVLGCRCRFEADDKYLVKVREAWNSGIQQAFDNLPKFSWESPPAQSIAQPQPVTV
jgi:putative proteasome-type protease